jgi:hypothetical protein
VRVGRQLDLEAYAADVSLYNVLFIFILILTRRKEREIMWLHCTRMAKVMLLNRQSAERCRPERIFLLAVWRLIIRGPE